MSRDLIRAFAKDNPAYPSMGSHSAPRRPLIGVMGLAGAGKDTFGAALRGTHQRIAFADPLKRTAAALFDLTDSQLHDPAAKEEVDPRWGLTPRQILQRLGTNVAREIHPDVWVRAALRHVGGRPTVVTDVRFPNEALAIQAAGGDLAYIYRDDVPVPCANLHGSEHMAAFLRPLAERSVQLHGDAHCQDRGFLGTVSLGDFDPAVRPAHVAPTCQWLIASAASGLYCGTVAVLNGPVPITFSVFRNPPRPDGVTEDRGFNAAAQEWAR